jgi:hypothetical protein
MNLYHNSAFMIALTITILIFYNTVDACTCETPEVCQAFARAEKVFVGELIRVKTNTVENLDMITAEFRVNKGFKGKMEEIESVNFTGGGCEPMLTVGQKYFVYKDPPTRLSLVCNQTRDLQYAKPDLAYARSIIANRPIFTIGGVIEGLTKLELAKVRVTILEGGRKSFLKVDKTGRFALVSKRHGDFGIEILLPSESNIWLRQLGEIKEIHGKKVEYSTRFTPNACDFRTIQIANEN